jgi:predicted enzyme related to lactoylglutathione lyase
MGSGMTVYYFVNSIEAFEKEAAAVGAKLVLPKTKESDHGWFANFKDIEGNRFGVYEVNWEGMKGQAGGEAKSAE